MSSTTDDTPERRNNDREIAQIRSAVAEIQAVLVQVRKDAHAKLLTLRALAGLVVMGIVVAVIGALIANSADSSSDRVDRTVTSVVKRFEDAAADPANVAAQDRARQRLIANCEAVAAIAGHLGVPVASCPPEPTTTTTTPGSRDG